MKTTKCDKCGKEINRDPMQQAHLPRFKIYVSDSFGFLRDVDLCNDCDDALYSWLKGEKKMSDTIKREDALNTLLRMEGTKVDKALAMGEIRSIPAADRPQGEWIDKGDYAVCSNCGAHSGTQYDGVEPIPLKTNFCPNCGARMKGLEKDE